MFFRTVLNSIIEMVNENMFSKCKYVGRKKFYFVKKVKIMKQNSINPIFTEIHFSRKKQKLCGNFLFRFFDDFSVARKDGKAGNQMRVHYLL